MRPLIPAGTPQCIHSMIERCWNKTAIHRPDSQQLNAEFRQMEAKNIRPTAQIKSLRISKEEVNGPAHDSQRGMNLFARSSDLGIMTGSEIEPRQHGDVSVLFAQVVGLPELVETMGPLKVSSMFDQLYARFDVIAKEYAVFQGDRRDARKNAGLHL